MKKLYQIPFLRRLVLSTLERINPGDIAIRHHWTRDRFALHSLNHKGYWYHGKNRKRELMLRFPDLVGRGDLVVEIGAHIGYVSVYLARLIGPEGQLILFEPGPNNLPYLRKNTISHPNTRIVEQAVTDYIGSARLYIDTLTGQNNSLIRGFAERNGQLTHADSAVESVAEVPCTSLDDFLRGVDLPPPAFVKIDVEGAELSVLRGMKDTLRTNGIALMVEVADKVMEVWSLLRSARFLLFWPDGTPVRSMGDGGGNVFCVKADDQRIRVFSTVGGRTHYGRA